jgi:PAS domain S-box-containing protein
LLTAGIFLLDLFSPSGVVVWVLYPLPLLLTFMSPRRQASLYCSAAITVLILIGFLAQRSGMPAPYEALNRLLGLSLMWGVVLGVLRYKMIRPGLTQSEMARERAMKDLTLAHAERAEAESAKAAAVEARVYAETVVLGAMAGQRRAEEEMLEDKLRLDGIVQSAMDAIITVDEDQNIVLFNQAAERMFERPAGEMVGRSLDWLIPERFRSAHGEHIRRFGRSGVTTRQMGALGTITGVRAGGEEFPIEAAISQIGTEGKRYFTVILRDITERKRLVQSWRNARHCFGR